MKSCGYNNLIINILIKKTPTTSVAFCSKSVAFLPINCSAAATHAAGKIVSALSFLRLLIFDISLNLIPMDPNYFRPLEIEMIRASTAKLSDRKHKAGQHD